jgi:hypothetical protein
MTTYHADDVVSKFRKDIAEMYKNEYCITFNQRLGDTSVLTKKDFVQQLRMFKEKGLSCVDTFEKDFEGKKYRIMCFNHHKEGQDEEVFAERAEKMGMGVDVIALFVFGIMIDAFCYIIPMDRL